MKKNSGAINLGKNRKRMTVICHIFKREELNLLQEPLSCLLRNSSEGWGWRGVRSIWEKLGGENV